MHVERKRRQRLELRSRERFRREHSDRRRWISAHRCGPQGLRDARSARESPCRDATARSSSRAAALRPSSRLVVLKMGIVAESAGAARRIDDRPPPDPVRDDRLGIVRAAHKHEHAVVVRAPVRRAGERSDQLRVVARVGRRIACESRALDAGAPSRASTHTPESSASAAGWSARSRGVPSPTHFRRRWRRLVGFRNAELSLRMTSMRAARASGGTRAACLRCARRARAV